MGDVLFIEYIPAIMMWAMTIVIVSGLFLFLLHLIKEIISVILNVYDNLKDKTT